MTKDNQLILKLMITKIAETRNDATIGDTLLWLVKSGCLYYDIENSDLLLSSKGQNSVLFDCRNVSVDTQYLTKSDTHEVFISLIKGFLVKFYKNIETGEITTDLDSLAKIYGYKDSHEMLSTDEALDALNKSKQKTGKWPVSEIRL